MVFLNQYSYLTFLLASPLLLAYPMARHAVSDLSVGDGGLLPQRPLRHRWGAQRLLLVGIALMALGSALLLGGSLGAILSGLLISSFGFFLAHACASAWVGQHVEHNRALASSLYLVGYYLGASLGALSAPFLGARGLGDWCSASSWYWSSRRG